MVIRDAYALGESDPFYIKQNEEITVDLTLNRTPPCPRTLLTGKVFFGRGIPARGAAVLVMDRSDRPLFRAQTNQYGVYAFRNILQPGRYYVMASARGYDPSDIKAVLLKTQEAARIPFVLRKSALCMNGLLYGKILETAGGGPVRDADVFLGSSQKGGATAYRTKSNQAGQYLIYNVLPGFYRLFARKEGYRAMSPVNVQIEPHSRVMLCLDLLKSPYDDRLISGAVTRDDRPVPGACVFLYRLDGPGKEEIVQTQEANEDGIFLFSHVGSGIYLVKGKLQNEEVYEKLFEAE